MDRLISETAIQPLNPEFSEATSPEILTPRQEQILDFIQNGLSTQQIADNLGLATNTVKIHIKTIKKKQGRSRAVELMKLKHGELTAEEIDALELHLYRKNLSQQEVKVFMLSYSGMTRQEISDIMNITIHTVRNHRHAIGEKLGVFRQKQLIKYVADWRQALQNPVSKPDAQNIPSAP